MGAFASKSVEIITSDPERRRLCAEAVSQYGFRLAFFASIDEALAEIERRASDVPPPGLFVLAGLGSAGAQAAIRKIRCHSWAGAARILAVDNGLTPAEAQALLDAGANECYDKPFLAPVFAARVRGALRLAGGA